MTDVPRGAKSRRGGRGTGWLLLTSLLVLAILASSTLVFTNRVELLRDVFVWAYERSCARYSAVRQSLGEPDPFRLHHRQLMAELIHEIVCERMDKKAAVAIIRRQAAQSVPAEDQLRFDELVETELMSLHEGNIARYRVRPSQYQAWKQTWR